MQMFALLKNNRKMFDENLQYVNAYKFSNHDIKNFVLLLRKSVSPYEYTDGWGKFSKTSLPEKEYFYSHLNMEDINVDYTYAKEFKI